MGAGFVESLGKDTHLSARTPALHETVRNGREYDQGKCFAAGLCGVGGCPNLPFVPLDCPPDLTPRFMEGEVTAGVFRVALPLLAMAPLPGCTKVRWVCQSHS